MNLHKEIALFSCALGLVFGLLPSLAQAQVPMETYSDPQGRFSIQYPSGWEVSSAENRFETIVAEFANPDAPFGQVQSVDVRIIEDVRDAADLVGDFGEFISLSLNSAGNTIPEFAIEEDVECEKYSISGSEDTCSILYSRAVDFTSDFKLAILQVSGLSSSDVYTVTYTSTLNEFDKNLAQAEQIINSFRIADGEDGNGEDSD